MAKQKRMVVVTTDKDRRGVFFGELVAYNPDKMTCKLKDAQMAIYWSAATKGVLGLAATGPMDGSRITPIVPSVELNGVSAVIDASGEAQEKWRAKPWA